LSSGNPKSRYTEYNLMLKPLIQTDSSPAAVTGLNGLQSGPGTTRRSALSSVSPVTAQQGVNTYSRNDQAVQTARNDISKSAALYLSAGPKRLSEFSLFGSAASTSSPLNVLTQTINSTLNRGIQSYLSSKSSTLFLQPLSTSPASSLLSSLNRGILTGQGSSTGTFVIRSAGLQTTSLAEAAGLYLKAGMSRLEQASILFTV